MKYLIILSLLFISQIGISCINEYRTLMDGSVIFTEVKSAAPRAKYDLNDRDELLKKLQQAEDTYNKTLKLPDYSDYGVMLIYNGQYEKARDIFRDIEKQKPNLYATAANLGTVYELIGQIDSALIWLNKAIKINPDSHNGSEWIHIKILEAKKKYERNEQQLWQTDILQLGLGENMKPENPGIYNERFNIIEIEVQLYIQLTERLTFIKPKDPIIGRLLFDLGSVCAITKDVKSALEIYDKAKEYGYSSVLMEKRTNYFNSLQISADLRNNTEGVIKRSPIKSMLVLVTIFAIIVGIFYRFLKKKRK